MEAPVEMVHSGAEVEVAVVDSDVEKSLEEICSNQLRQGLDRMRWKNIDDIRLRPEIIRRWCR